MAIFSGSRYINTPIYARNGDEYIFDIRQRYNFNLDNAEYHTVIQGETADSIAYSYYGHANLSWAILDANKLMSELDIQAGMVLVIPPYEQVVSVSE